MNIGWGQKKFQSFTSMLKFEEKKTLFSPSSSQSHLSLILLSSRQFLQFGLKSSVLSSEKKLNQSNNLRINRIYICMDKTWELTY